MPPGNSRAIRRVKNLHCIDPLGNFTHGNGRIIALVSMTETDRRPALEM